MVVSHDGGVGMIKLAEGEFDPKKALEKYQADSTEYNILNKMIKSDHEYIYSSQDELDFEIGMRKNIVSSSYAAYRGRIAFRTFRESKCNEDFWDRRPDGGFVLKRDVKPSDAINDIFRNGRRYGTECATVMVMIFYKAVLDMYGDKLFNTAFAEIILMNWQELDDLMGITTQRRIPDFLHGDCRYFRNPDVNPLTPEWQGENAIYMGGSMYFGHGIGIASPQMIIEVLNSNRIEDAQASAYLMDTATRPDFRSLYLYKKHSA